MTDANRTPSPFPPAVVDAVVAHMNADHLEDSLAIVRSLGGRPDATSARMVGLDGVAGHFRVEGPTGAAVVSVPWSRPISERAEIREELARMVHEIAGG
jgi:putative heme iron utilization protein